MTDVLSDVADDKYDHIPNYSKLVIVNNCSHFLTFNWDQQSTEINNSLRSTINMDTF